MTLEEIRASRKIHDAVWTYNLCASVSLTEAQWQAMEAILKELLETVQHDRHAVTEKTLYALFTGTTCKIEALLGTSVLDESAVYEYGGLNSLYAEIVEAFGFPVKYGQYALISDFVYFKNDN